MSYQSSSSYQKVPAGASFSPLGPDGVDDPKPQSHQFAPAPKSDRKFFEFLDDPHRCEQVFKRMCIIMTVIGFVQFLVALIQRDPPAYLRGATIFFAITAWIVPPIGYIGARDRDSKNLYIFRIWRNANAVYIFVYGLLVLTDGDVNGQTKATQAVVSIVTISLACFQGYVAQHTMEYVDAEAL
eukprot:Rmarinus@m.15030